MLLQESVIVKVLVTIIGHVPLFESWYVIVTVEESENIPPSELKLAVEIVTGIVEYAIVPTAAVVHPLTIILVGAVTIGFVESPPLIIILRVLTHLLASVTVTEYVPAAKLLMS